MRLTIPLHAGAESGRARQGAVVLISFDGDEADDKASLALGKRLQSFGARCERLRPGGAKDWNEALSAKVRLLLLIGWPVISCEIPPVCFEVLARLV